MSSSWEIVGAIVLSLIMAFLLGAYFCSIIWVYRDAEMRAKSGSLVGLVVALIAWPLGLVAWLVFRPNHQV